MLVERGFMARHELQSILRSAIIDALLALTTPLAGGSSVSDIRFEAPGVHWAAAFVRLPLESVQAEVAHRADQLTRAGVAHTVPIALADLDRGPAVLTRDQWAIACRVNGALTPRDLARQTGLPLYETVTALATLIRRGLCTLATPVPPQPREAPTSSAAPPPPAPRHPGDRIPPLPANTPSPTHTPAPAAPSPTPPNEISGTQDPSRPPRPTGVPAQAPSWTGRHPDPESAASPLRARPPRPSDVPAAPDLSRSPGPRHPGDVPVAFEAREPHDGPSPAWGPPSDQAWPESDTGPQTNLAAPRDVPPWDDAPPLGDPGAPGPARAGFVWGATPGPAGPPPPRPAEPPATGPEPAPVPPAAGVPPVRRQPSFTPVVTPAPLTSPELAASPTQAASAVAEGAAPPAPAPLADVPIVRPSRRLPPAHPGYRRPPRPEWSTATPPVPSAVLAAPAAVDSEPAAAAPDPDEPDHPWWPRLPQRDPGAGLVQPPRNATVPMPARDWRSPEPAAEAHESEAFASTGPDLLRRVLDGLRRLT